MPWPLSWTTSRSTTPAPTGTRTRSRRAFAESRGLPGTASSDAHSVMELGVAQTVVPGPVDGPAALLALLPDATIIKGRASYLVRGWTPVAKVLQRIRGNRRIVAGMPGSTGAAVLP